MREPKPLSITEKWGPLVADRGFAQIPNYLLLLNQFVDEERRLSPVELLILVQLAGAWWHKDQPPFPSMSRLAVRCGVSERQVQRAINRLVKDEFIGRMKRRSRGIISSNAYDLRPLAILLTQVAKTFPNAFPRKLTASAAGEATAEQPAKKAKKPEPQTRIRQRSLRQSSS